MLPTVFPWIASCSKTRDNCTWLKTFKVKLWRSWLHSRANLNLNQLVRYESSVKAALIYHVKANEQGFSISLIFVFYFTIFILSKSELIFLSLSIEREGNNSRIRTFLNATRRMSLTSLTYLFKDPLVTLWYKNIRVARFVWFLRCLFACASQFY